jgi:hypothetical protein
MMAASERRWAPGFLQANGASAMIVRSASQVMFLSTLLGSLAAHGFLWDLTWQPIMTWLTKYVAVDRVVASQAGQMLSR